MVHHKFTGIRSTEDFKKLILSFTIRPVPVENFGKSSGGFCLTLLLYESSVKNKLLTPNTMEYNIIYVTNFA